jgi:maltose alpha-D-glucosyltransferase/alpha-amylase
VSAARTSDLWWKNAVVYCLDVETFRDHDGDGVGDFAGLTDRIDHLAGIGVSCLWLMPFYPSPNRDDGYDVADHYGVDPRLGTLGDLVVFLRTAKDRGLRVIVDLVVNHTSDRHPWFVEARSSPDSRRRDWYVWVDEPPETGGREPVFPGVEDDVWTYDEQAGQWYLHHFFAHQPDLNTANPEVRDEIARIAGFWLQLGVDGFRVDAVPYLIERGGDDDPSLDPHEQLRDLRRFVSRRRGDAVLLGEVNLPPDELVTYFGDDDELHLVFDFPLNQALYLALARRDAGPLRAALEARPEIPEDGQWAVFVRNHDELTLDQLSDDERREVFDAFGPTEREQLFGRGLRRRLPPMLGGDERAVRMVQSLCLSLPGTPVLYYGEEIGMGDHLGSEGRMSVRTPMQWDAGPDAGFSRIDGVRPRRAVADGGLGPDEVNVADQERRPDSMLNWTERMIRLRRETPELGWGRWTLLDAGDPAVLAHRCDWEDGAVVLLHRLDDGDLTVRLDLGHVGAADRLVDLLDASAEPIDVGDGTVELPLGPWGHRWLRLRPSPVRDRRGAGPPARRSRG